MIREKLIYGAFIFELWIPHWINHSLSFFSSTSDQIRPRQQNISVPNPPQVGYLIGPISGSQSRAGFGVGFACQNGAMCMPDRCHGFDWSVPWVCQISLIGMPAFLDIYLLESFQCEKFRPRRGFEPTTFCKRSTVYTTERPSFTWN